MLVCVSLLYLLRHGPLSCVHVLAAVTSAAVDRGTQTSLTDTQVRFLHLYAPDWAQSAMLKVGSDKTLLPQPGISNNLLNFLLCFQNYI